MRKQINLTIKAHLLQSASCVSMLVAVSAIPSAMAQVVPSKGSAAGGVCCQNTVTTGTGSIVPGTSDSGNHCDDCDTAVTLAFPVQLCGMNFNSVLVSSNGRLDFVTNNEPGGSATSCLPAPPNQGPYDKTIFALWHNWRTDMGLSGCSTWANGCGIFTSVSGVPPNRVFNIEWHVVRFANNAQTGQFEVRLYENSLNQQFDVIYGTSSGVTGSDTGGVQVSSECFTQDFCNTAPPQNVLRAYTPGVGPLTVVSAVSRKTHGGAGEFDVDLPLTGTPGIECRATTFANDYRMVVIFSTNVTVTGTPQAEVISGMGCVGSETICNGGTVGVSGATVTIPLTNIANAQTINVRLNGVNSAADTPLIDVIIPMTKLVGDTNANGSVSSADVAQTKGRIGQPISASNFRSDVNASGGINAGDVTIIKQSLP